MHWFSVEVEDPEKPRKSGQLFGFDIFATISLVQQNLALTQGLNEKYPELFPTAFKYSRNEMTEADYTAHFKSVLHYLIDHSEMFEKLPGYTTVDNLKSALNYVEKNGLKINAIYLSGVAENFHKLSTQESVFSLQVLGTELFNERY